MQTLQQNCGDHGPSALTYSQVSYFCGHCSPLVVTHWSNSKARTAYLLMGLHQPRSEHPLEMFVSSYYSSQNRPWRKTCGWLPCSHGPSDAESKTHKFFILSFSAPTGDTRPGQEALACYQ